MKSVVVIGGGVSGLVASAFLSRQGIQVQLLEAGSKIGGSCATTNIDGYTFNDGALFLAMPGMLDQMFSRLGLDRTVSLPLRKITANQTVILPDNTVVIQGDGLDVHISRNEVPQLNRTLVAELEALVSKWDPVLNLFADDILLKPFSVWHFLRKGWKQLPKFQGTVASELKHMISDGALRSALSGALLYTGLPPKQMPIISILGAVSMLRDGLFLPEGGMNRIPEVLAEAVRTHGGEIYTNTRVKRIVVDRHQARAVIMENGELIEADAVLSTVSGMLTYGSLLAKSVIPASMRKKAISAPLSHRAISLQLGLENDLADSSKLISHNNSVLPFMDMQGQALECQEGEINWMNYSVPTVTMPELAPKGGSIVEMFLAVDQSVKAEEWDDARRDDLAERAIEALARRHQLDIKVKRVRSPKDFCRQLGLYEGALYGLSPGANPRAQFPHKSPIPGLFHAGQTTYPGFGIVMAGMSGLFAAEAAMLNQ